jgi:hypothetical protein
MIMMTRQMKKHPQEDEEEVLKMLKINGGISVITLWKKHVLLIYVVNSCGKRTELDQINSKKATNLYI